MKKNSFRSYFQGLRPTTIKDENQNLKHNFSSTVANTIMTDQLITPPARVWDRIEAILDEQDNRRRKADDLIASSFGLVKTESKKKRIYLATVAGFSLVAGLLWMVR